MALRGFTLLKEQYSTSGQSCQWWDNDMALRGLLTLLQRTTVHRVKRVSGGIYGVEMMYPSYSKEQYSTSTCHGGITIWRLSFYLRSTPKNSTVQGQTVNGGYDMALRGLLTLLQRTVQYIGSNVSVVG